jgi:hypothetical protein
LASGQRQSHTLHELVLHPLISVASTNAGQHLSAMKSEPIRIRRARPDASSGSVRAIQKSPSGAAIRNCGSISSSVRAKRCCAPQILSVSFGDKSSSVQGSLIVVFSVVQSLRQLDLRLLDVLEWN